MQKRNEKARLPIYEKASSRDSRRATALSLPLSRGFSAKNGGKRVKTRGGRKLKGLAR